MACINYQLQLLEYSKNLSELKHQKWIGKGKFLDIFSFTQKRLETSFRPFFFFIIVSIKKKRQGQKSKMIKKIFDNFFVNPLSNYLVSTRVSWMHNWSKTIITLNKSLELISSAYFLHIFYMKISFI